MGVEPDPNGKSIVWISDMKTTDPQLLSIIELLAVRLLNAGVTLSRNEADRLKEYVVDNKMNNLIIKLDFLIEQFDIQITDTQFRQEL